MRQTRAGREYRIKWEDDTTQTWEPESNLNGCQEAISDFHSKRGSENDMSTETDEKDDEISQHMAMSLREMVTEVGYDGRVPRKMSGPLHELAMSASEQLDDESESDPGTPSCWAEAMKSPDAALWIAAWGDEKEMIEAKETYIACDEALLPPDTNIIPSKLVFKIKTDENGKTVKYKVRLTPKGYKQIHGRDYHEVFAATGKYKTLRVGIAISAIYNMEMRHLDVPSAFLNAEVEEDLYIRLPPGLNKKGVVYKLQKALYGLKQSPRNWGLLLTSVLVKKMGYQPTVSDPCMYHKKSKTGKLMYIFVFVDDLQVSFFKEDEEEWEQQKQVLVNEFDIKDMGEPKWLLGMKVDRDRSAGTITLDMEQYVLKALTRFGLLKCKSAFTPAASNGDESSKEEEEKSGDEKPADQELYMQIVGTLLYASISARPDISHAVHKLTVKLQSPTAGDMRRAKRVLQYLAKDPKRGLVLGAATILKSGEKMTVSAYTDADYANSKRDRKSVSGYLIKINGVVIMWSSKKQRVIALSTCESELMAVCSGVQEVLWTRSMLRELNLLMNVPSVVYCDNQSTVALVKNGVSSERTKHIEVRYHFVTQHVNDGNIEMKWIPTNEQEADIFTKTLARPLFTTMRELIMRERSG